MSNSIRSTPLLRTDNASFQEVMAEQLGHAPWLLLSLAIHAVAVLLLWLVPAAPLRPEMVTTSVLLPQAREEIEDEPPPPEVIEPEPVDPEQFMEVIEPSHEPQEDPAENSALLDNVDAVADQFSLSLANHTNVGLGGGPPARYRGRGPGGRGRGGLPGQPSVEAALQWLRDHQDSDGRWDCDDFMKHDASGVPCDGPGNALHDVGVTGLALLAFLGDGTTLRAGPYRDTLRAGVEWLRTQQDPDNGCLGSVTSQQAIYDHAIATLALCEAFGLSRYRTLRGTAQKAIDYLLAHRNPYGVWRYQPRSGDQDMSVTGWAAMALVAAHEFELAVDARALADIDAYIDGMTDPSGRVGYLQRGGPSSRHAGRHELGFPIDRNECMTAVGLFCKALLDHDVRKDPLMQRQLKVLMRKKPAWHVDAQGSSLDFYAWYYGSYAVYQAGEPHWSEWSRALTDAVVKRQRNDGNFKGSWDPVDAWGEDGGRVYATAILALSLQAYYRYGRTLGAR
jgi:hypothetical protein